MLFCEKSSLLNFASFDSMNLVEHEHVRKTGVEFMSKWGMGDLPSRPVNQLVNLKRHVEKTFASMTLFETATILDLQQIVPSQVIQSLTSPKTLILKQDSFAYSPTRPSLIKNFDISNESHLTSIIEKIDRSKFDTIIILVESISSTTGKITNLKQLGTLSKALRAFLIVDDTNSFSAMGRHGLGLASTIPGIDLVFGSFGKTFGNYASYVLSSNQVKDFVLTSSPSIASATNLSPLILGFVKASLDLLPTMGEKRALLSKNTKLFRELFIKTGLSLSEGDSHIISLSFDNLLELKHFNFHLSENQCIANTFRIQEDHLRKQIARFVINLNHSTKELSKLSTILRRLRLAPYCEAL